MSYSIEELSKLNIDDICSDSVKCKCGMKISESNDFKVTSDGPLCKDCYFDELDEIICRYPIGRPPSLRK